MRIDFEQVSFSYADAGTQKRRGSKRGRRNAGATPSDSLERHGQAAWGNDPDELWALQDVSFSLEPGEFLGIAGHTGSGKSTLIQHLNGLLHPTRGRVLVDGADLADKAAARSIRGAVGVVFQYPEHQLFAGTAFDDVAFGPRNLGLDADAVTERVERALAQVGLDVAAIGTMSPFELSGGQQRRVAFAGVLAMDPQVLVLDEPVAGLDPAARASFLDLIKDLHAGGLSVVMVSHNMNDLARLCDRVLVLSQGRQLFLDVPEAVFAHEEELHAAGLDVPEAQRMANSLRARGLALPTRLYATAADLAAELAALYAHGDEKAAGRTAFSSPEPEAAEPEERP
ncbi:MAG: energy-coupling factor transporter ATPase [Coriobacteriia bacterium]|nr:energy-coupling factor transporter ATPase [Coriobacteriia bacterium]